MDILKEKTKFLATKLAALQSELVVSKNIFQAASREVESMFQKKYFPETPVAPSEQKKEIQDYSEEEAENQKQNKKKNEEKENKSREDAPDQPSAGKPASPEVKKMFKKIAHQCHPDKLQDMEQGFEKAKKEELYQKARAALENDDLLMMADIANELGLEVPDMTASQLKETEKKIISIKKELSMIESTAVWHWFFTEDPARKDQILKQIFDAMYGQYNIRS